MILKTMKMEMNWENNDITPLTDLLKTNNGEDKPISESKLNLLDILQTCVNANFDADEIFFLLSKLGGVYGLIGQSLPKDKLFLLDPYYKALKFYYYFDGKRYGQPRYKTSNERMHISETIKKAMWMDLMSKIKTLFLQEETKHSILENEILELDLQISEFEISTSDYFENERNLIHYSQCARSRSEKQFDLHLSSFILANFLECFRELL